MRSLYRYGFGLVLCAASCGQLLDVDAPYELDPNASGSSGSSSTETCGDGIQTGTEVCDDGNKIDADGCDSNCTPTKCGNGFVAGEEECDDGNTIDTDECTNTCRIAICGDGLIRASEQCDDGNAIDGDDCDSNCTITSCGNGIKTQQEGCDDGNTTNGDGCSSTCIKEGLCGNGIVEPGEECDDMNLNDGDGCSAGCTIEEMCGNGVTAGLEECDDGNPNNGDGCDSNCTVTACGNGVVSMGETCDDQNQVDGDGCDSNCFVTACGNGIVTAGEECDDGNTVSGDTCDSVCKTTVCGDGKVTMGEQCDDANQINNDGCGIDCRITPRSCVGLAENCGPFQNENCCTSIEVPGGTYNRTNNASYPATVNGFRLDRFEVTMGRFRKFVEAYPGNKPVAGAGVHPVIPQSGWNSTWDTNLAVDQATLRSALDCSIYSVWTDVAGAKEVMPINCVKWYEAFAFCAWDGGRLPTEAEWNYVASGGNQQRYYPWSNPAGSTTINASYANYNCYGDGSAAQDCKPEDVLAVGSRAPMGDGLWKHADLAGSMLEWTLDLYDSPLMNPCVNCANLVTGTDRVARGGNWGAGASFLANMNRDMEPPGGRDHHVGLRCARGL